MAGNDAGVLDEPAKARLNVAVNKAEEFTGLEFCVIVSAEKYHDPRAQAERAFHRIGLHEKPAVMVMVVPDARTIEVLTAAPLAERLSDADCSTAVAQMVESFKRGGIVEGLEDGIAILAERAGAGRRDGPDLPNVVEVQDVDD